MTGAGAIARISIIPCLKDNYAYLLSAPGQSAGVSVDASEAEPVERALKQEGLSLAAILSTHHHWDHVGGNEALAKKFPGLRIFGHISDRGRIDRQTDFLEHGGSFSVAGLDFRVLHIPGHTLGAIAYITNGAVFTGDTLFAAGCGRLFEGTPAMMYESLNIKLGALDDSTRVYCGHEYTASNLRFAMHVEPGNRAVQEKSARIADLRARGEPSVPSTIGEERATNPFMRCDSPEIQQTFADRLVGDREPSTVLAVLRAAKDVFK